MRRLGWILLAIAGVVIGGWIALLVLLPNAPTGVPAAPSPAAPALVSAKPPPDHARALPMAPLPWTGMVLTVPIAGVARGDLADSWGDPRDNGLRLHHGTDIMAPVGTPIIAAAPGTIEKMWESAKGGKTLYIRSPARDWTCYYAHLSDYAPGLHEGQVVTAGQLIAYVGDTGNAGAGNYHLHFGLTHTTPDQHWYEGQDVDPYPYLAGRPDPR